MLYLCRNGIFMVDCARMLRYNAANLVIPSASGRAANAPTHLPTSGKSLQMGRTEIYHTLHMKATQRAACVLCGLLLYLGS